MDELGYRLEPMSRNLVGPITRGFSDYVDACDADDNDAAPRAAEELLRARRAEEVQLALEEEPAEHDRAEELESPPAGPTSRETTDEVDQDWARDIYAISANETFPTVFDPEHPTVRAVEGLLDALTRPYIRSGLPIYLDTYDHALVLCGRAEVGDRTVHFVHDDQTGPYLATESLPSISKDALAYQSGVPIELGSTHQNAHPPIDRVIELLKQGDWDKLTGGDSKYAVWNVVIPTPSRVLLPAGAAIEEARRRISPVLAVARQVQDLPGPVAESLAESTEVAAVMMMGIDYKRLRRQVCRARGDEQGVLAYSAVQLPEWVVVVEGALDPGSKKSEVTWECVFDASSSEAAPRVLFARVINLVVTVFPRKTDVIESARIAVGTFPRLKAPRVVGKVR